MFLLFVKAKYKKTLDSPDKRSRLGKKSPGVKKALDELKKSAEIKKKMGLVEESFVRIIISSIVISQRYNVQ